MRLCLVLFFLGYYTSSSAQFLTQDSDGNSTILGNGALISFSSADSELSGSYTYLPSDMGPVVGIKMAGSSSDGVNSLFDGGEFASNKKIELLIGTKHVDIGFIGKCNDLDTKRNAVQEQSDQYTKKFRDIIDSFRISAEELYTCDDYKKLYENLETVHSSSSPIDSLAKYRKAFEEADCTDNNEIISLFDKEVSDNIDKRYKIIVDSLVTLVNGYANQLDVPPCDRLKSNNIGFGYIKGGFSSNSFSYDTQNQLIDFSNRIVDSSTINVNVSLGMTGRIDNDFFGFAFRFDRGDNTATLTDNSFTFSTTESLDSGVISKEQTLSGKLGEIVYKNSLHLDFDYMKVFPVHEDHIIGLGGYTRFNLTEDEYTFGLNLNLFTNQKRSFIGSFFFEFEDITDSFRDSISFGVSTQLGLHNLFNAISVE